MPEDALMESFKEKENIINKLDVLLHILLAAGLAHSNSHKGQTESVNEWMEQGRD